jgi:hypothetical protein
MASSNVHDQRGRRVRFKVLPPTFRTAPSGDPKTSQEIPGVEENQGSIHCCVIGKLVVLIEFEPAG